MTDRTSDESPGDADAGRADSSLTRAVSQSQFIGQASSSGFLRVADLQESMLGEFRLLRRIGGGGMAEVWLAEQTSLKRQVAVKVMRHAKIWADMMSACSPPTRQASRRNPLA